MTVTAVCTAPLPGNTLHANTLPYTGTLLLSSTLFSLAHGHHLLESVYLKGAGFSEALVGPNLTPTLALPCPHSVPYLEPCQYPEWFCVLEKCNVNRLSLRSRPSVGVCPHGAGGSGPGRTGARGAAGTGLRGDRYPTPSPCATPSIVPRPQPIPSPTPKNRWIHSTWGSAEQVGALGSAPVRPTQCHLGAVHAPGATNRAQGIRSVWISGRRSPSFRGVLRRTATFGLGLGGQRTGGRTSLGGQKGVWIVAR